MILKPLKGKNRLRGFNLRPLHSDHLTIGHQNYRASAT